MSQTQPVLQRPPGYRDPNFPVQRPPPRNPNFPPLSFYPPKKRRSRCRTCCCCLSLFLIMVALFFIAAGGFFYVWFEPRVPIFHLKSLKIPKFNVTAGPDGTSLASATVIGVEVQNPNSELSMVYDRTHVYVNGPDGLDLGTASLAGFTQGKKNTTVLKVTTQVKQMIEDGVGRKLKVGFKSKKLPVTVVVRTGVGLGEKGWTSRTVGMRAVCGDFTLKQMESGDMPSCSIKVLEWFDLY